MPAYNQESLIGEAIESVVNQTYDNWELIIGDDCSVDNTYQVASEYQNRYPDKIKLFRNEMNLGITGNSNEILKRCNGLYIAFSAGDDLFLPEKIERQVQVFTENPNVILIHHDVEAFDHETGRVLGRANLGSGWVNDLTGASCEVAKKVVERGGGIAGLSVLLKKDVLPACGYRNGYTNSDFLFWVESLMESEGEVVFLDLNYARYRHHENNITKNQDLIFSDQRRALDFIERKYPELRKSVERCRAYYLYRDGVLAISGRRFSEGRKLLLQQVRLGQHSWKWVVWWMVSWFKQVSSKF